VKILDLSAGSRSIWFNRLHPSTVYVDIRPEMIPSVIADTQQLPFKENFFDLVVFDPPHVTCGPRSVMAKYYSSMEAEDIKRLIQLTSNEAYRVTTSTALMAFKWNDHDVKLERVIKLMEGWEPLFGQRVAGRTKHRSGTYWCMLRKREDVGNVWKFLAAVDHE